MQLLMNDHLFIERNANNKVAQRKKVDVVHDRGIAYFIYMLDDMHKVDFGDNYPIDFGRNKVRLFTLETLRQIISAVEVKLKRGVRRTFVFYSSDIMMMSDNLTISLTEYVICYYREKYGINIYITHGRIMDEKMLWGMDDPSIHVHNGFYTLEASINFIQNSFLLNWLPGTTEVSESDFYCTQDNSKRFKMYVGTGPWDASIAISKCTEFLKRIHVGSEAIDAVCDVVGELAPNAVEHGKSDCLIDICYVNSKTLDDDDEKNISIVIYNFSEKLLWTDLFRKVFVDNELLTYKKERIDTVRSAWDVHSSRFSKLYNKEDFYNLMAFQKISGRQGDRSDGGLGINTLIQNVQQYSTVDYCYVLSGNGALRMDQRFIKPDNQDYIAFNEDSNYVGDVPDKDAVMKTEFFMPGVAYNLSFFFEED